MGVKTISILIFFALILSACVQIKSERLAKPIINETRLEGEQEDFFNHKIRSWAILDATGNIRLIGLTSLLSPFTEVYDKAPHGFPVSFDLPAQVKKQTGITHIDLHTNNETKHVLVTRYYFIEEQEKRSINCSINNDLSKDVLPEGYKSEKCENQVGARLVPTIISLDPDHPTPFVTVNFLYVNTRIIAIELSIEIEKILLKESFTVDIPKPNNMLNLAVWPGVFTAIYNSNDNSYDFSLWSFQE